MLRTNAPRPDESIHRSSECEQYPSVQYQVNVLPSGGSEIIFPTLVPSEQITVAYLYYPPVFWNNVNSYTKSDEGLAKIISVLPSPQPSPIVRRIFSALVFLGSVTALYVLFEFALYLWRCRSGG